MHKPTFIVGATASGKSAAAIELARERHAAILCMDAMQVYRGADIGTSKPTAADRAEIPHGGLDLCDIGESFDVAEYLRHAADFLAQQRAAYRPVIIVGGTGLYFRALTAGLCEAPSGSDELRAELNALTVPELQSRLKAVDPAMLEQIDIANPRRVIRAIEVMEATGKSLRAWQDETPEPLVKDFSALWIQRSKEELEKKIAARVEAMLAQGWETEVRELVGRHGIEVMRKFSGIGYREITQSLPVVPLIGQAAIDATNERKCVISVATRQYAKRQLTWFAREPNLWPVTMTGNQSLAEAVEASGLPISL